MALPPRMLIKPREPFSLHRTLRFILSPPKLLNGRVFEPLLDYWVDGEYRRVMDLGAEQILYGVREESISTGPALRVRILAGPDDAATRLAVAAQVAWQFSTELDLNPFYRRAAADPVLRRLTVHFRGMRIPQAPAVYETLLGAILEQQVNLSFAHQVKKALVEAYGRAVEFEGRRYNAFPEPAALAIATPRELRRLQISGPKARYLIGISRLALDGTLELEGLREHEPARAYEKLLELKGVGHWTAQYAGLRALGHTDSLPAADVGLQKAIQNFYGLPKQPTPARVEKLARAWAPWRSYATFYLWLTFWEDADWRKRLAEELRAERKSRSQRA